MPASTTTRPRSVATASGLHPRNRHRGRYDFPALLRAHPPLARFVAPHPVEGETVNFADPAAVLALNRALLAHHYGFDRFELPAGALCPPVPGRADYLHHLADLLANVRAAEVRVIPMRHGEKRTRILAWRFSTPDTSAKSRPAPSPATPAISTSPRAR